MRGALPVRLAVYAAASLLHHVHNAGFLEDYPNMPGWISPAGVYAAWLAATATGLAGYVFLRRGHRFAGVALMMLYGFYGLGVLAHYAFAPPAAHSPLMNLSIALEAATAAAFLLATLAQTRSPSSNRPSP